MQNASYNILGMQLNWVQQSWDTTLKKCAKLL